MATSKKTTPESMPIHILDWLRTQTQLPVESAAAFWRTVGHDVWDTTEHWTARWAAWFHAPARK